MSKKHEEEFNILLNQYVQVDRMIIHMLSNEQDNSAIQLLDDYKKEQESLKVEMLKKLK